MRLRRRTRHREQRGERAPAATFCRVLGRGVQSRCFEGVGTILATLETDAAVVRRQCPRVPAEYRPSCLRGAGLTA